MRRISRMTAYENGPSVAFGRMLTGLPRGLALGILIFAASLRPIRVIGVQSIPVNGICDGPATIRSCLPSTAAWLFALIVAVMAFPENCSSDFGEDYPSEGVESVQRR